MYLFNIFSFLFIAMFALQCCTNNTKQTEPKINNLVISKVSSGHAEIGFTSNSGDYLKIESLLIGFLSKNRNLRENLVVRRDAKTFSDIGKRLCGLLLENSDRPRCTEVVDLRSGKMLMFISFAEVHDTADSFVYELSVHASPEQDYLESIFKALQEWNSR